MQIKRYKLIGIKRSTPDLICDIINHCIRALSCDMDEISVNDKILIRVKI